MKFRVNRMLHFRYYMIQDYKKQEIFDIKHK